jgi:hypothetical protein
MITSQMNKNMKNNNVNTILLLKISSIHTLHQFSKQHRKILLLVGQKFNNVTT